MVRISYVSDMRKWTGHKPLLLTGAVVIIVNPLGQLLLQLREDGTYGLPGGLAELGESLEETARREAAEETGLILGDLELLGVFSGRDSHFQLANGDAFYSTTAVYLTRQYAGTLQPDDTETKGLEFYNPSELPDLLTSEYRQYIEPYVKSLAASYKAPVSAKGIILHRHRVLLVKNERGEWELPGGRMEPGETPEEAVLREIHEELGIRCTIGPIIDAADFEVTAGKHVFIVTYGCSLEGEPDIRLSDEHTEYQWFTLEETAGIALPPVYYRAIRKYVKGPFT